MKKLLLPAVLLIAPTVAQAQDSAGDTASQTFQVIGTVPTICSVGSLGTGNDTFDLGVLIELSTGLLRTDLSAPDKVLTEAFCSGRSTIEIEATQMTAQNATGVPPTGFSRGVNYVATASGWTTTPASFDTAAASNPAALQERPTAFSGDITVGISDFSTAGGDTLRLVADTTYNGVVTVTISAAS